MANCEKFYLEASLGILLPALILYTPRSRMSVHCAYPTYCCCLSLGAGSAELDLWETLQKCIGQLLERADKGIFVSKIQRALTECCRSRTELYLVNKQKQHLWVLHFSQLSSSSPSLEIILE